MKRALFTLVAVASLGCQTVRDQEKLAGQLPTPQTAEHSFLQSKLEKIEGLARQYPKVSRHHYDIAAIHFQNQNYHESASALKRAISLSEERPNPEYHFHLGRVYMQMQEIDKAEREFRSAVAHTREERYSGPRAGLAYVLALKKKIPEAITHFEICKKVEPKNPEFDYFLGALYDMSRDDEKAIYHFREYLDRGGVRYRKRAVGILENLGVLVELSFEDETLSEEYDPVIDGIELVPGLPIGTREEKDES